MNGDCFYSSLAGVGTVVTHRKGLPRERGRDDNRTREEGRFLPSLRLRDAEGCCSCSTASPRGGEQSGEVKWRGNASSKLGLLLRKSRTNVRQCVRACPSVLARACARSTEEDVRGAPLPPPIT